MHWFHSTDELNEHGHLYKLTFAVRAILVRCCQEQGDGPTTADVAWHLTQEFPELPLSLDCVRQLCLMSGGFETWGVR